MSIFQKLFLPFIFGMLFIGIVSIGSVFFMQHINFDMQMQEKLNSSKNIFYSSFDDELKTINELIKIIQENPRLYKEYKSGNKDEVKEILKIYYKQMNLSFDITHLYLIKPDKKVFYRAHNPTRRGDVIDRFTLNKAKETKKASHGLEFGIFRNFTFRVVHPWIVKGELIGYIELGKEINHISKRISKYLEASLYFGIDKVFIEKIYTEDNIKNKNWTLINNHYILREEDSIIPSYIEEFFSLDIDSNNRVTEVFLDNHVGNIKLIDARGKVIGEIVISTDISKKHEQAFFLLSINISIILVIIIILLIIQYRFSKRFQNELDISQTKLNNEKLKAEEAVLVKSAFLANMSHEIRTPMNGIIGMTHLVLKTDLKDKQKNYIEKIDNSAKSLLAIINDILDLSKIEAQKLHIEKINFNMKKVIDSVVSLIELKAKEKGLKLVVNYGKDVKDNFYGDSLRLCQILTNLLSNAVKFTDNGEIGIYISKIDIDRFRFEIKDTGIGLNKEQISKLFQPFSQADCSTTREYGGTGLGLTISKKLVELMDGKIWVESKEKKGSSFIFKIDLKELGDESNIYPASNEIEEKSLTIEDENSDYNLKSLDGKKILLVEDNKTNQLIILGLLEESNIDVEIANNGQEAIEKFENNKYYLILMDLQMPVMDGYEATKIIRSRDKEIPIIALSANVMKADVQRTYEVGMNMHLGKPINIKEFYKTLLKYK